jgi:glycosyltransferase involved in cell wall biosynthesis
MKIFQIITLSELGGAQSVVANLSNVLIKNHEVLVIAGEGDDKLFQMLDKNVIKIKVHTLKRKISLFNDLLTFFSFLKLYLKYNPDIIHLHSSKAGILGRLAFPKNKIVYTVHGFDSIRLMYRKYLFFERLLQKRCKMIVCVSHYDENNLRLERITNNVRCIYNGYKQGANERIELTIPQKYTKKILCIARISKQKRFKTFLEIALLLPDYAFIWIGNQEPINNLPENVFCFGNLPNAGLYNQFIDLFVLPSNYEGLPIVIIEAMCFGKPVVASNVGGISEIVVNNENGYVVENKAEEFVQKIKYILENEDVYKKFSENALHRFQDDLTAKKMAEEYMKVYISQRK